MSGFVEKLERYPDLEVSTIRSTKINKVLKAIIKLPSIPRDEEFKIRQRSAELLSKWIILLGANETGPSEGGEKDEPTTNGVHKDDGENASEKADGSADVEVDDKPEEKTETPAAMEPEKAADAEVTEASKVDAPAPTAVSGDKPSEEPSAEKKETVEGETSEAHIPTVQPASGTAEATA